ncbi:MAG: nickel pincer cofactor biosynthesis protein LarB [Gemmatimonadetes bacterium]|nr:nickel pincer cofactor biosynthesis protein LarB [Gemmatimonadota bacterium]
MIERVRELLEQVAGGDLAPAAALEQLRHFPLEDVGLARIDHHRSLRQGQPEILLASHKTVDQVVLIAERMAVAHGSFLATRTTADQAEALCARFPGARWNELGRTVWLAGPEPVAELGRIAIVTAGTSDLPVAEEAAVVAESMGASVARVADVGVAGLHRLLAARAEFGQSDVIIVVAGMEGALPSVVAGLVSQPVIAVPTSVGYGASFGGLAALLAMLNSCAQGVTVVNIDNGFGAATAAIRILGSSRPGGR